MTEDNLKAAFAGESQAHMKYLSFAQKAESEGKPNVARLFRAVSLAEQYHASGHLRVLGGVGNSGENLAAAIGGETFEVNEMYPGYLAVAAAQEETQAQRSMTWALEAEKVHAGLYARAKHAVDAGQDVTMGKVYVCGVCGWTGEGDAPDKCPLCGAPAARFVTF
jgi:rubrerythrin